MDKWIDGYMDVYVYNCIYIYTYVDIHTFARYHAHVVSNHLGPRWTVLQTCVVWSIYWSMAPKDFFIEKTIEWAGESGDKIGFFCQNATSIPIALAIGKMSV